MDRVMALASDKGVVIFTKSTCCMCHAIKVLFEGIGVIPIVHEIDKTVDGREIEKVLVRLGSNNTTPFPAVFIDGKFMGSANEVMSLHLSGSLTRMLGPYRVLA